MTTRPVAKVETAKPAGAQRKTRQRAAVAEILSDRHDFRTAQQIHDDLRHHGDRIGLATVYRTLQLMTEAGDLDAIRTAAARRGTTITWCVVSAVGRSRSRVLQLSVGPTRSPSNTAFGKSATILRSSAPAIPAEVGSEGDHH